MKVSRLAALTVLFSSLSFLAESAPQTSAKLAFDRMKSLDGNWEGKNGKGDPVNVSFRLTSGGSVIMSEIQTKMASHSEDMISMIHIDGDRLLLTHYCPAGNQPRMQASASADGKTITFGFVDATNLARPEDGHMQSVFFTFVDANHHKEEWHFIDHGKVMIESFELQRSRVVGEYLGIYRPKRL